MAQQSNLPLYDLDNLLICGEVVHGYASQVIA
jgi:hypothetical protein